MDLIRLNLQALAALLTQFPNQFETERQLYNDVVCTLTMNPHMPPEQLAVIDRIARQTLSLTNLMMLRNIQQCAPKPLVPPPNSPPRYPPLPPSMQVVRPVAMRNPPFASPSSSSSANPNPNEDEKDESKKFHRIEVMVKKQDRTFINRVKYKEARPMIREPSSYWGRCVVEIQKLLSEHQIDLAKDGYAATWEKVTLATQVLYAHLFTLPQTEEDTNQTLQILRRSVLGMVCTRAGLAVNDGEKELNEAEKKVIAEIDPKLSNDLFYSIFLQQAIKHNAQLPFGFDICKCRGLNQLLVLANRPSQ